MIAILSDIHANLEALDVVLNDMATFNIERIYCLGDIVGYGPDPFPCIQRSTEWDLVLKGNFDHAGLLDDDLSGWGAVHAKTTIFKFRAQLSQHHDRNSIIEFLNSLPSHYVTPEAVYVHGTPRNPLNEYLFPEDIYNERKMEAVTRLFDSLCFCGHTHVPGIFRHKRSHKNWEFFTPEECDSRYSVSDEKVICNVGSVGQPRDGDPRASYVLFTPPDSIHFRRVEYDLECTIQKMRDQGDEDFGWQRLREAR